MSNNPWARHGGSILALAPLSSVLCPLVAPMGISVDLRKAPDNLRPLNGPDRNLVYGVISLLVEQRLTAFPSQSGEIEVMDMAFLHPFYREPHKFSIC